MRIGRIRIDALLGTGGMGEVYRGWDEKLERAVALKVVHADKRFSAAMRNRFLREARVLSQLDHPNICRIYDVLEREDRDYLVLEFVEGTTLRDRKLSRREALDAALQVARVLTETHARGIVHRDLKPDNIMLTGRQVKVLDFGLARPVLDSETHVQVSAEDIGAEDWEKTAVLGRPAATTAEDTHTSVGSLVGTLQYMSPEQARGLPVSEATDIYSLGVLLYEMLSGQTPYGETESTGDLLGRVRRAAIVPYDSRDRALDTLLRRMLALYPADRPRADEVAHELERILDRPARIKRRLFATGIAAVVVALIAGAFFVSRSVSESRSLFGARTNGKIALLPFRNATGDRSLQWIEFGLADLVGEGMRRVRGVDVVPAEETARSMRNLGLRNDRDLDEAQRRKLLAAVGADALIAPVVTEREGKYTIRYAALTAEREESPRQATSTVLVEAAKQMSVALAQRVDPSTSAASVRARLSLDNIANLLYAMGLQELRARGPRVAAHYFNVCVDRDPDFIAAKIQLADCHKQMADTAQAEQLLEEALSRARATNDREMLARGLIARADWAIRDGDAVRAERAGAEAYGSARALNDRELMAHALSVLGYISWRTGNLARAKTQFEQSLRIFTDLRNASEEAELHDRLGVLADSAAHFAEARQHYETALAIADRIGDKAIASTVIGNLANAEGSAGRFARAEELTRRQAALTRETGDTGTEIFALVNLGLWLWAQGKEAEAVKVTQDASVVAAKVGNARVETVILSNLATATTKLGDLAAAHRYNDAAVRRSASLDDPEVERDVQLALAYTFIREGKLDEAEKALDRAERWQLNARVLILRARLAYARGDYARAFDLIARAKARNETWLIQNEQMYRAFAESAKTGKPSTIAFESRSAGVPAG